ncbi:GNAT family N-acetyltransferase [Halococcoides cellulosivorans]|uniref:GNAT family N-acetyltransferase n=1 Tax=Halococcoides cellulosivorans TaxID=1679096 RepID=A0A2R4X327_9EURY|nr:N-acetyltransferase [Halococcoides cellulosivorans]AWB28182.1 GNAT family N-acetyltransferase [Halococcoides cellulosivorans]
MSTSVEAVVVDPGSDDHVEAAWELKERIRESEGVLRQRRGFFVDAYRRSTVFCYLDRTETTPVVGFAVVRRDGYVLFLAVAPDYRGHGFGRRLIARVADENGEVNCHVRATNRSALGFYEAVGFEIERRIDSYYEDGGDAYYLQLRDDGLAGRFSIF